MHAVRNGVVHPHIQLGLDVNALHAVHHGGVKVAGCAVVLGWVAGAHYDPPQGQAMLAKGLVLQKLQHGGGEGLAGAVDLVKEEDALCHARLFDGVVSGGDDFAHRIARHLVALALEGVVVNVGQSQGALPGVVRDGVRDKVDAQPLGDLRDNGCLANARRSHKDERALHLVGNERQPAVVL